MEKEDILLIATFIIALMLVVWYIFGHSPTVEQINLGILLIVIGWLNSINSKLHRHLGEHEGYKKAKQELKN